MFYLTHRREKKCYPSAVSLLSVISGSHCQVFLSDRVNNQLPDAQICPFFSWLRKRVVDLIITWTHLSSTYQLYCCVIHVGVHIIGQVFCLSVGGDIISVFIIQSTPVSWQNLSETLYLSLTVPPLSSVVPSPDGTVLHSLHMKTWSNCLWHQQRQFTS